MLRKWYAKYNRKFFFGKLPRNLFLFWNSDMVEDAYGRFYEPWLYGTWQHFPAISLNAHLRAKNIFLTTLLHEMIHASTGIGHGRRFDHERKRLFRYKLVREILL